MQNRVGLLSQVAFQFCLAIFCYNSEKAMRGSKKLERMGVDFRVILGLETR